MTLVAADGLDPAQDLVAVAAGDNAGADQVAGVILRPSRGQGGLGQGGKIVANSEAGRRGEIRRQLGSPRTLLRDARK